MNSLSWLLYLADVLPSFGSALTFITLVLAVISTVGAIASLVEGIEDGDDEIAKKVFSISSKTAVISLSLFIFSFLIPEKQTFYLIAASEIGEEALLSEEAIKLRKILSQELDKLLQTEKD